MKDESSLPGEAPAAVSGRDYEVIPCWPSCESPCCFGTATATREELERIAAALSQIMPLLQPAVRRVVARRGFYCAQLVRRPDFCLEEEPHWLRIVGGRCVFYGEFQGGHCALHTYCAARGLEAAALKPLVCRLFPLSRPVNGVVSVRHWEGVPCVRQRER
jgi:hypothetical protein